MKEAPARINMIMQVVRVVPITLCQNELRSSEPCHHAINSEPSTPHAAHSVADAQPLISTTNTSRIKSVSGMRLADSFSFSRKFMRGSGGGIFSLFATAQKAM